MPISIALTHVHECIHQCNICRPFPCKLASIHFQIRSDAMCDTSNWRNLNSSTVPNIHRQWIEDVKNIRLDLPFFTERQKFEARRKYVTNELQKYDRIHFRSMRALFGEYFSQTYLTGKGFRFLCFFFQLSNNI